MEDATTLRISHEAKIAMADYLTEYSMKLGKLAVKYATHAKRNTITGKDILLAEKTLSDSKR